MAKRIVIDPITRIEGHLRLEVEVQGGKVTDAWSSGTMVRGFEIILKGRDPRDAWAFCERACGVCTSWRRTSNRTKVSCSLFHGTRKHRPSWPDIDASSNGISSTLR